MPPVALGKDCWGFSMRTSERAYKPVREEKVREGGQKERTIKGRRQEKEAVKERMREQSRGVSEGGEGEDVKIEGRWMDADGGRRSHVRVLGWVAQCHLFV